MSRDWRLYLEDILDSCAKIRIYTHEMSKEDLLRDHKTYDAVVRNLEIIGEAAKNLPEHIRNDISLVEWRRIAGMRDILAHAYFGIDDDILWDVIQNKVPELEKAVSLYHNGH